MTRRRDPRAERAARRAPGTIPRYTITSPPAATLASAATGTAATGTAAPEHAGLEHAAPEQASLSPAAASFSATPPAHPAPSPIVVDSPAFLIAVVADAPSGLLTAQDKQALGAARILATGGGAVLLLSAAGAEESGRAGADRTLALPPQPDPASRAALLATLLTEIRPRHTLFPETPDGGDLARRLAARTNQAYFADTEYLTPATLSRRARAGRAEQRAAPTPLIGLAAGAAPSYAGPPREARLLTCAAPDAAASDFHSIETLPANAATTPLAEADFVIAAGNGVTDFQTFHALAAALNATPGASRMLCDAGLMPRAAQIGASGTVLGGTCYLAFGIAGAPQHLQGIAGMAHVIAVNTDLHAAMIKRADLAIVADAQAIMPALFRRLAEHAP